MQSLMQGWVRRYKLTKTKRSHGVLLALLSPVAFAFILTFSIARICNNLFPDVILVTRSNLHIHHFTFGLLTLVATSVLALVYDGPRAKFLISLLFGFGLGLTFDEYSMWLHLDDQPAIRWEYDGFLLVTAFIVASATIQVTWRWWDKEEIKKRKKA